MSTRERSVEFEIRFRFEDWRCPFCLCPPERFNVSRGVELNEMPDPSKPFLPDTATEMQFVCPQGHNQVLIVHCAPEYPKMVVT